MYARIFLSLDAHARDSVRCQEDFYKEKLINEHNNCDLRKNIQTIILNNNLVSYVRMFLSPYRRISSSRPLGYLLKNMQVIRFYATRK